MPSYKGRAPGPEIVLVAEYDAIPGMGHACGHNIISAAAVGAALSLRAVMESIDGTLVVAGTPAEEQLGGKLAMLDAGVFKGAAAVLMAHPRGEIQLGRLTLAHTIMEFTFHGKSSHPATAADQGRNALDACIATFNGINALKKHLTDDAKVYGVILEGGTGHNTIPDRARAVFGIRAATRQSLDTVIARVGTCAEAGAMMAGCIVDIDRKPICTELNVNDTLAEAFGRNAARLGHEVLPRTTLVGGGSTDMGNVSWVAPVIYPFLKVGDASLRPHSQAMLEAVGTEEAQKFMLDGAKILAMTAVDVWTDADVQRGVLEEFQASTQRAAAG